MLDVAVADNLASGLVVQLQGLELIGVKCGYHGLLLRGFLLNAAAAACRG